MCFHNSSSLLEKTIDPMNIDLRLGDGERRRRGGEGVRRLRPGEGDRLFLETQIKSHKLLV